ncbi:hypothetical protein [Williamsia sp. 1135]|uniref:hypothetical protein n=1 Tax=Williamsia sp. 1135 TaxID=1889262 RepID=UPI000A11957D|nr:hypothetical protein [Williamsia sp. 1135]ORM24244.1 hypothetical protein BFL43_26860 [Williamsia sp. 1135]
MNSPILVVIIGCEVGFWVMVFAGMCLRYLLHLRTISTIVLAAVPVLDALLLAAVALDIHQGSTVETVHRLAGVYLGVTVAFGHSVVTWADGWFAHRFADGPAPARGPKKGQAAFRREVRAFGQWMCAATISGITVVGLAQTVADPEQASALYGVFPTLGVITVLWLLTGPVWALFDIGERKPRKISDPA